jgi:hypothetical protein
MEIDQATFGLLFAAGTAAPKPMTPIEPPHSHAVSPVDRINPVGRISEA